LVNKGTEGYKHIG